MRTPTMHNHGVALGVEAMQLEDQVVAFMEAVILVDIRRLPVSN